VENRPRGGQALERGEGSPEGASAPRARRSIARGGRQALERGGELPEGYRGRSVGGPLWFLWAVGLSTLGCDHTECIFWGSQCVRLCFIFFQKGGFPQLLGDPYGCPDSNPRSSAVVSVRNPQRLTLADGTFFSPGCCAVPWGRANTPAGVAPEALQECGCSCKFFHSVLLVCEVLVSASIGGVSAGLGGAIRMY
jgi:hypothetical protein